MKELQLADPVLKNVHGWKESGKNSEWCEKADQGWEMKYYWHMWERLYLRDGVVYRSSGKTLMGKR